MRPGQRAGGALDLVEGDAGGRLLCTVQFAAAHGAERGEGRHINIVRRCAALLGAVGCDVRTGALLYDAGALGEALRARKRRKPRQAGRVGHATPCSRSVT